MAIHAEQNAILQCGAKLVEAYTMYCSNLPCFTCSKLIANTGIREIYFREEYADTHGLDVLLSKGIRVVHATEQLFSTDKP